MDTSQEKPTTEQVKKWDEDKLIDWIKEYRPNLVKVGQLEKLKAEYISGEIFLNHAGDVRFFKNECGLTAGASDWLANLAREFAEAGGETAGMKSKLLSFMSCIPRRQQANNLTGSLKVDAGKAFKTGIKYTPPHSLVSTSGKDWVFQPHADLYRILADNVFEHYYHYKRNEIDKNYIPAYFYLGGAGTGKSRHGSEFASSVQQAITSHTQHPLYHELAQRLKNAFVFHVSFENETPFIQEEMIDPWNAIGIRMLWQLLGGDIEDIRNQYVAIPESVFQLVGAAENVDLYEDFTGILVVDGLQMALTPLDDEQVKNSSFHRLVTQIGCLSLMKPSPAAAKEKKAPFIMTCITATCLESVTSFMGYTGRRRVHLPLNRIEPPTWKYNGLPVLKTSRFTELLVRDIGGHARAMEIIADLLAEYPNGPEAHIDDFASALSSALERRYREAFILRADHALPIAQCILSRREILLEHNIPGSKKHWHDVTASGLIWFQRRTDYSTRGYLEAPYIWFWMLARLSPSEKTERVCLFLRNWEFNDYEHFLSLENGDGVLANPT